MSPLPPPPPGIDLSESRLPAMLGAGFSTFVLALVAVCLRFLSRRFARIDTWWDDWLMLPAMAFATTIIVMSATWLKDHGSGKHIWAGPPDAGVVWGKGLFIEELAYVGVMASVKMSLLCFYWRIFSRSNIRTGCYFMGSIVILWAASVLLVSCLQCAPLQGFWERFALESTTVINCSVKPHPFFNALNITNILTDVGIILLPIPCIWKLRLPRSQKFALSGVFLVGWFVVSISTARLIFVIELDLTSPDVTWTFTNTQTWTFVEVHIAIFCACLPSLRPILMLITTGSVYSEGQATVTGNGNTNTNANASNGHRVSHVRAWKSHISSQNPASHREALDKTAEEDHNHLFDRMSNNDNNDYSHVDSGTPGDASSIELAERGPDAGIRVTTEVHVDRA